MRGSDCYMQFFHKYTHPQASSSCGRGRLTLTAVHLVTVKTSERLSPTRQTHRPHAAAAATTSSSNTASSFLGTGHRSTQTAIYQGLQLLHCHTQTHRETHTMRGTSTCRSVSELSWLTVLQFSPVLMKPTRHSTWNRLQLLSNN